ncbi:hypothetical protein [Sphingobium sp. RAC03]|uniref:hypothetical protein n=1 Tax=Sphingobium sp. RAC03 TaxID=1843368 RepID=UPI001F3AF2F2|nr:hypothetical protein [Sphingobium sp. RAC03]
MAIIRAKKAFELFYCQACPGRFSRRGGQMSVSQGIGETALMLLDALGAGDLLYLADDEQDAEAIASALMSLAPDDHVVLLPSSDTLPGDSAPASPSNIGKRVAALRHLRRLAEEPKRRPLATIMSGEGAARLYADPAAFAAAPPSLRVGEPIDPTNFAADMEKIGYVADDRSMNQARWRSAGR